MIPIATFIFIIAVLLEIDKYLESQRKWGDNPVI